MSQPIVINIGAIPNDGTGDPLRTAFNDVNLNFANVFAYGPVLSNIQIANNTILTTNTNGNLILNPNGVGVVQANAHVVPDSTRIRNLGSPSLYWDSAYVWYGNFQNATIGTATIGNIGNLTIPVGNIHILGGTNGYVLQTDGTGNLTWTAQTGGMGNGVPGGANTQVQYNDAGAFGGTAGFTFDNTSNTLSAVKINTTDVFNSNGIVLENSDLTQGATAAVVIPTNGSSDPIQLNNTYGNIALQTGAGSGITASWSFNNDGNLQLPDAGVLWNNGGLTTLQAGNNGAQIGSNDGQSYVIANVNGTYMQTLADTTNSLWHFGTDGNITLPNGGLIAETSSSTVIAPPVSVTVSAYVFQGSGYTNGTYTDQPTTGGTGTGLTLDYTVNFTEVVSASVNNPGTGYLNGDVVTIPGGSSDATILISVVTNKWIFNADGTLSFPVVNGQTNIQQQRYGMGNLVGYLDGGWVLGEFNGSTYGSEGIRIAPGIEGATEVSLPSDGNAATQAVIVANYGTGNVNITSNTHDWTFGAAGNLTLPTNTSSINYANGQPYGGGGTTISNKIVNGTSSANIEFPGGNLAVGINLQPVTGAWIDTYGNIVVNDSGDTAGESVVIDAGGNVYVTGAVFNTEFNNDQAYIRKLDSNGTVLWQKGLPNAVDGSDLSSGETLAIDGSGNIYWLSLLYGNTSGIPLVAKLDPSTGEAVWTTMIIGATYAYDMTVNAAGQVFVVTNNQGRITSLDTNGAVLWSFDPSNSGTSIVDTGTFVIIGYSQGTVAAYDYSGNLLWVNQVFNNNQEVWGLAWDGTDWYASTVNGYITKISGADNSTILWQRFINRDGTSGNIFNTWIEYSGGYIYATGTGNVDGGYAFITVKIDASTGDLNWARSLEANNAGQWYWYGHHDISVLGDYYAITGYARPANSNSDKQVLARLPVDGSLAGSTVGPYRYVDVPALTVDTVSVAGTGYATPGQPAAVTTTSDTTLNTLVAPYPEVNILSPFTTGPLWTFDSAGELYTPQGGRLGSAGKGWTGLDGGYGNPVSLTSYYANGFYAGCITNGSDGTINISTYTGNGLQGSWTFDNTGTLNVGGNIISGNLGNPMYITGSTANADNRAGSLILSGGSAINGIGGLPSAGGTLVLNGGSATGCATVGGSVLINAGAGDGDFGNITLTVNSKSTLLNEAGQAILPSVKIGTENSYDPGNPYEGEQLGLYGTRRIISPNSGGTNQVTVSTIIQSPQFGSPQVVYTAYNANVWAFKMTMRIQHGAGTSPTPQNMQMADIFAARDDAGVVTYSVTNRLKTDPTEDDVVIVPDYDPIYGTMFINATVTNSGTAANGSYYFTFDVAEFNQTYD